MLLALSLGAAGYYLALSNPVPDFTRAESYGVDFAADAGAPEVDGGEAVELRYLPGDERRFVFSFRQTDTSGEAEVTTRIDVGFDERRRKRPKGEGVVVERTYRDVGVTIRENDKGVGPRITEQMESLLVGSREVGRYDPVGRPTSHEWRSVTNPQVRETLSTLHNATLLLMPRFRRGAVNPKDSWSYRLPADVVDDPNVESLDGEAAVESRYVGTVERDGRRLAVVERSIELSGSATIKLEEEPEPRNVEVTGEGSGRALFDIEGGGVVESRLSFRRELTLEGGEDQRTTRTGRVEMMLREKTDGSRRER